MSVSKSLLDVKYGNKKTAVVVFFLAVIFTGRLYKKDPQQQPEVKRLLVFLLERHVSKLFLVCFFLHL